MGKLKKRSKLSQQRHKANQLAGKKNGKSIKANESKQLNKIAPLLEKLNSTSINDKSMAINSINLICNSDIELRKLFLKNDLIKHLLKLINDSSDEIVVESFGLLKNLIIEEGYNLSTHLWRLNIWESLENSFKKAIFSFNHLNDSGIDENRKLLLIQYIDNLIGCINSLINELKIEIINNEILPNLINNNILKFIFVELIGKNSNKLLLLTSLEFFYDFASISNEFLKLISSDEEFQAIMNKNFNVNSSNLNDLAKIYLIGINFQIFEFNDEFVSGVNDEKLILIFNEILSIINKIDLNLTVNTLNLPINNSPNKEEEKNFQLAKENFKIIDISMDLFTTIIEIKGEDFLINQSKSDAFIETLIGNLLDYLKKLIESGFKNNKILICFNNLSIYLKSVEKTDELYSVMKDLNENIINKEFEKLINDFEDDNEHEDQNQEDLEFKLEIINDYLNFELNLLEIEPNNFPAEEKINKLIEISTNKLNIDDISVELLIQFNSLLIMYLSIIAKNCNQIEITKKIIKFIVDYSLLKPIEIYNESSVTEIRKKFNYLIEETLDISINSIFALFDDNYYYNKEIYFDGQLNLLLKTIFNDYKKIYKNIDKNINMKLKRKSEDTLNNLERFLKYKESEII